MQVGYALNGVYNDYPDARPKLDRAIKPAGKALMPDIAEQCVPQTLARYAFSADESVDHQRATAAP